MRFWILKPNLVGPTHKPPEYGFKNRKHVWLSQVFNEFDNVGKPWYMVGMLAETPFLARLYSVTHLYY